MAKNPCKKPDPETYVTALHQQLLSLHDRAAQRLTLPMLRELFLLYTRLHFSSKAHLGDMQDALAQHIWTPDGGFPIELGDVTNEDREAVMPAIYVRVSGIINRPVALGDAGPLTDDSFGSNNLVSKNQSTAVIFCVDKSLDLSALMAHSVFDFFFAAKEMLFHSLHLNEFLVTGMGEPRERRGGVNKGYVHEVMINIGYSYTTTVHWESHRVKRIVADLFEL
jgi:hypothetical protein